MTKVDIISGFLGSGKTTFIKKLLAEALKDEKVVLIENEFGEVGIDGGFLKESGITITEMNSGCICCSLVGDFDKNLREVVATYSPDRIIIEPSGVGKLSDVMTSVTALEGSLDIKLNALVTVVNALKAHKQMRAFGEFFNNQIEFATTVVLSRSTQATEDQMVFTVEQIKKLNPKAKVITTAWAVLDGKQLLSVMEGQDNLDVKKLAEEAHESHEKEHHHHHHDHDHEHEHEHDHDHEHHHDDDDACPVCGGHHHHDEDHDHDHHHEHEHDHEHHHHHDEDGHCCCGHDHDHEHHHHHHDADEIFISWGKEIPKKFERSVIENALKAFAETEDYGVILRAKGMVECTDGTWAYYDLVDGDWEIREGAPDYTSRLVVIGCDLKEHEIEKLYGLED